MNWISLGQLAQTGVWAVLLITELWFVQKAAYYYEQSFRESGISRSSPYFRWMRLTYLASASRIVLFPAFSVILTSLGRGEYSLEKGAMIRIIMVEIALRVVWSFTDWRWSGRVAQRINMQNRLARQNGHPNGIARDQ